MRMPSTCVHCSQAVYVNTERRAAVRVWVHTKTGSMYCDRDEEHVAEPTEDRRRA